MRLDVIVTQRFGLSRRRAQAAIREGRVDLAGHPCLDPARDLPATSPVTYDPHRPRRTKRLSHLEVLYEDAHILIVNKPAHTLTQPTPLREPDTLLERAGRYLRRKWGRKRPYVGIVHRLDRETSGALLLVTAARALRPFQELFRTHAIERVYLAVAEGFPTAARGTIELPLIANRGDGRRGVARGSAHGVHAVTHYEVMESFGRHASLLACRLGTGRTHQIRIHLAAIGHPVVEDHVYGSRAKRPGGFPRLGRQALHAQTLGFIHPTHGAAVRVEAPLPADLARFLNALRERVQHQRPREDLR